MDKTTKENLKIFAGVGLMTAALLLHLGLSLNPNNKTKNVVINDFKKITATKDLEESEKDKKKGR